MPVDNNMPHGNHFASNGPRPSGAGSSAGGNRRMPAPDTTEAFMMASRSGGASRPRPAQPVGAANTGARAAGAAQGAYQPVSRGGQGAYQPAASPSAYQAAGRGGSGNPYSAQQGSAAQSAYAPGASNGSGPKKGKGKIGDVLADAE